MTRDELLEALVKLQNPEKRDPEQNHVIADALLLVYINDQQITRAFMAIKRWYS